MLRKNSMSITKNSVYYKLLQVLTVIVVVEVLLAKNPAHRTTVEH
jgi:hypothetical protein